MQPVTTDTLVLALAGLTAFGGFVWMAHKAHTAIMEKLEHLAIEVAGFQSTVNAHERDIRQLQTQRAGAGE